VIGKDELMREIWTDTIVEENNLSQNISILRRVLGEKRGEHRFIATVPGHGFKFVADVREIDNTNLSASLTVAGNRNGYRFHDDRPAKNEEQKTKDKKTNRLPLISLIVLSILALGFLGFYIRHETTKNVAGGQIKTVAILPFKPLVAENREEALEMGMADTLIARLGGKREIVVRPLSSVRKFGNLEQDALSAGRALDVEVVLDGSIQRWGDRIRVNVRLIKVADGTLLWTGTFDEKFTDIFVVQDAISNRVAAALQYQLSGEEQTLYGKRRGLRTLFERTLSRRQINAAGNPKRNFIFPTGD